MDDRDAALVTTFPPGAYTVVVNDESNNNPGVALFDFYDLDPSSSQLVNLSTRGRVETQDRVIIGSRPVLIRPLFAALENRPASRSLKSTDSRPKP